MRQTQTNENQSQEELSNARNIQSVPKRRGSKYADILLQRLQTSVLSCSESAIVGVLSFAPRQGVTTTAINLGIRAADHHYAPSLVVDGNFRNHKVTRLYRFKGNGFSECLNGQSSLEDCIKKTKVAGFHALGAGKNKLSKQILFDPEIGGEFFKVLRNDFRFSIIDFPAFNEPSLIDSVLPFLDGVIVVAKYGAKKEQLLKLQSRIRECRAEILGMVMTGNPAKLPGWLPNF